MYENAGSVNTCVSIKSPTNLMKLEPVDYWLRLSTQSNSSKLCSKIN